ncbi:putative GATA transcription factor 6 [Iris pallida]|uniref:GATA transcription factor 6 n=1 Tax=Iris pallida TaxID=29817 RepID=A0AAX6GZP9_IRIPA|nr:putative GATA transcription factor 6 [Iris pallida]
MYVCLFLQVEMEMLCPVNHHHHHHQNGGVPGGDEGSLLTEEFVVDDLLDLDGLGGLTDAEKEAEEEQEKEKVVVVLDNNEDEAEAAEENNSNSSSLSSYLSPLSELALPAHDVAELEWVSRLMDDSLSEFPPVPSVKPPAQDFPAAAAAAKDKGKRSKRSRPSAAWYNWNGAPDSSSSSSTTTTTTSSASSSSSYSSPLVFFPPPPPPSKKQQKIPKKRGRKPKLPVSPSASAPGEAAYTSAAAAGGGAERRCSHCGVNKTPQWRAGPMGAKTLCNACGVRFKSGRLLPEYRPACSPTFLSHVHSNSHRKVLEMRRKKEAPAEDDDDPKGQSLGILVYLRAGPGIFLNRVAPVLCTFWPL